MVRLIDRYIFKEWCKALAITITLILGILILEDMYKNLKNFLEHSASLKTLLLYYFFIVPNCLSIVLPISFFISVLYVLNDMQAHNEIVALRASGMTIFSITRSFWMFSGLLMALMVALNAHILPYASNRIQLVVHQIEYNDQREKGTLEDSIGLQSHLSFYHPREKRLWHIHNFSLYTNRGAFTTLSFLDTQGHEQKRVEAKRVSFNPQSHTWRFESGRLWFFSKGTFFPKRFKTFDTWDFKGKESPRLMMSLQKPLKNLGVHELKKIIRFVPGDHPRFLEHRIKYFSILSSPLICIMIVLLAVPFSLSGVRTNPMVGVSKAVGLFFLYYIVSSIGRMLGMQGTLSPMVAAWFPNLLMLSLGLLLYHKLAPQ